MKQIHKIGIAGAGGLGSFLTSFLFNYGEERKQFPWLDYDIDLYDNDTVDLTNLLHQNYTLEDLGKRKAEILAGKYFVTPVYRFMGIDDAGKPSEEDFGKYDVIFSCVDNMTFRQALYEYGWAHPNLVWIDGRCNSRNIGVYNSSVPKSVLEKTLSKDPTRYGCLRTVDKENKVSHATPLVVAGIMVQFFLNYLRDGLPSDAIELML